MEKITPRQRDLLHQLIEECAEVQKEAAKILRFGFQNECDGNKYDNAKLLAAELGDLHAIAMTMTQFKDVDETTLLQAADARIDKLVKSSNAICKNHKKILCELC